MKRIQAVSRPVTRNTEPSKTDQSQKRECDVNNIVRKFTKTGQISHMAKRPGVYADVSDVPDLMGAISIVQQAQEAFDALPATLRKSLNNDPQNLKGWLQDPANTKEAVKYGLLTVTDHQYSDGRKQAEGALEPKGNQKKPKKPSNTNNDDSNDDE